MSPLIRPYDAKTARTKRDFRVNIPALLRDCADLDTVGFGAYHLILYAMWATRSCDLPDDDLILARCARMTKTTFKRRCGPTIREKLSIDPDTGRIFSRKLRRLAQQEEKYLYQQHLNAMPVPDAKATAPGPVDFDDPFRVQLLAAMGVGPDGLHPMNTSGRILGSISDMAEVERWLKMGLPEERILRVVRDVMKSNRNRGRVISSFRYFDRAMTEVAADLVEIENRLAVLRERKDERETAGDISRRNVREGTTPADIFGIVDSDPFAI